MAGKNKKKRAPTAESTGESDVSTGAGEEKPAEVEKKKEKPPFSLRVKENVEAFFFAVILVLVIRYFSVEAFQIPTKSMEPTLRGDPVNGDRILVDKFIYHFTDPQRWDVVVFKYPLNRSRNFIKRLVGQGGERIAIRNGDIYVNGRSERKPDKVQKALWIPIYSESGLDRNWKGDYKRVGDGAEIDRLGVDPAIWDGLVRFVPQREPGEPVMVGDAKTGLHMPDVRFAFEAEVLEGDGGIRIVFESDEEYPVPTHKNVKKRTTFDLAVAGGPAETRLRIEERLDGSEGFVPLYEETSEFRLTSGAAHEVEAVRLDGWTRLVVGDRLVFETGADLVYEEATFSTFRSMAGFAPFRSRISVTDVELGRDIYYTNQGILRHEMEIAIPPGRVLFLGDNSANSRDSRLWSIFRIHTEDGQVIEGELSKGEDPNPIGRSASDRELRFRDTNGFERSVLFSKIEKIEIVPWLEKDYDGMFGFDQRPEPLNSRGEPIFSRGDPAPFYAIPEKRPAVLTEDEVNVATVSEDLIVGRAFFVFWPVIPWHAKFVR